MEQTGTTKDFYYVHSDYLGSIEYVTDQNSSLEQELSYDPWGRLRNPGNWTYSGTPELKFDRGYTFHEHLPEFTLINMNGRVYDPALGRMLSPDNYVQWPGYTQNFNRYGYCYNNPLKYTDPSGESFWLAVGIVAAFTYLKAAHDNTPEEDQGNPAKWAWNPLDWSGENTTVIVGVQGDSDGNITGYAGLIDPSTGGGFVAGYNSDHGWGAGSTDGSGNNSFYYPSVNYNAPEQNAVAGIYEGVSKYYRAESNFQNFRDEYWARRTSFEVGRLIYTGWAQEGWNFDGTKDDTWYYRSEALINIYPEAWFFGGAKLTKVPYRGGGHFSRLGYHHLGKTTTKYAGELPGKYWHLNIKNRHLIINRNFFRHLKYFKHLK